MDEKNRGGSQDKNLNDGNIQSSHDNIQLWKQPERRKVRQIHGSKGSSSESGQSEKKQRETERRDDSREMISTQGKRKTQTQNKTADAVQEKNKTEKKFFFSFKNKKQERSDTVTDKRSAGLSRPDKLDNPLGKDNLSREARQKIWKKQIVSGTADRKKSFGEVLNELRKRYQLVILLLVIVAGGAGVIYYNQRNQQYYEAEPVWQIPAAENPYSVYREFNGLILHYSQDGVSCLNQDGEILWNQAFNMDVPGIAVSGEYAAIYDIKGNSIYICDKNGCTGKVSTSKNILNADVSSGGIVAVVLDDKTCNYIDYYRKDGTQVDIEIKTLISGDGYPLDIAISPDAKQLMTSYIYANSGAMMNQVVFRNFEIGKNNSNRVVGGFLQYEQTLVPDVLFFDDQNSAAVAEQSIDFYSTKNAAEPVLARTQNLDARIKSVFYSQEYIGVVQEATQKKVENITETAASSQKEDAQKHELKEVEISYNMLVFDKAGNQLFSQNLDFEYDHIDFSGDGIVAYNSSRIAVYNMNGVCRYQGKLLMEIKGVMRFAENSLVVYGNGALQRLTLK